MTRPLKVFGWLDYRAGRQVRCIVAATTKAEVARLRGVKDPRGLFNLDETWNADEVRKATSEPGVIFWAENRFNDRDWKRWWP